MKRNIIYVLLSVMLFCAGAAFAGGKQEQPEPDSESETTNPVQETITITDALGREVTLKLPIKTVVSGILTTTEALTILGVQDRIVGIDWVSPLYPTLYGDLTELPVVTNSEWYNPNYEMLFELNPDLFITMAGPQEGFEDMVKKLSPDIPVVTISSGTNEQVISSTEMLGKIFQCEGAAADYIEFYKGTLDQIKERVADIPKDEKVRVYYEAGADYFTFGENMPLWNNQIALTGGVNIAADMKTAFGVIDPETVIMRNPEVMIALAMTYPFMDREAVSVGYDVDDPSGIKEFYKSILNRSELSEISAVKEGRVHVLMSELPVTSVIGYSYAAKWLYPDLFTDFDPQAIHQEFLNRFMRIDYDLDTQGVFVYPKP